SMVIGTTGLRTEELKDLEKKCLANNIGCLVAPNFAIGAVLMMQFAKTAAKYLERAEIIEFHHPQKKDAPSGTAIKTAEGIMEMNREMNRGVGEDKTVELVPGARGGRIGSVNIHSVRLSGFVAHQEVIFGGEGQTLTIRHDSLSRVSFMPGIIMAIRYLASHKGFYYGLEKILDL
ncbi:MAG: 4-hydroxy-tetrahydrodipicolinate reductase, partial [Atribacterota bacterium]